MPTRRQTLEYLVAVACGGAILAVLAVPGRVGSLVDAGRRRVVGVTPELPEPVVAGVVLLGAVVVWLLVTWTLARVAYRLWRRIGPRVRWAVGFVLPDSPLVKFATGLTAFLVVVLVIVGVLPSLVGDLGESEGGAASLADELGGQGDSDWEDVVDGDTVGETAVCRGERASGPDRDGDGLPDDWERAGETPDGVPLPGADPDRKDLYVQVNYGSNVEALTAAEREQLRSVWEEMPVENPDGSTGIRLHLDDDGGRAGNLGEEVVFSDPDAFPRYYTEEHLGDRLCVYRQVTYGRAELGGTAGLGSTPGYAAAVEGRSLPEYEGDVSFRVAVTTHELLHNVAGRVDGRPHTDEGWLAGGSDEEFLSGATADQLNASGLYGPAR